MTKIFGVLICMNVHQNSITSALSKFNPPFAYPFSMPTPIQLSEIGAPLFTSIQSDLHAMQVQKTKSTEELSIFNTMRKIGS
jgi:hypothetical protein